MRRSGLSHGNLNVAQRRLTRSTGQAAGGQWIASDLVHRQVHILSEKSIQCDHTSLRNPLARCGYDR
jgi:hypothetical protein